ncbi:unnamed protein product [Cylindrotheca closterium]|uniref:Uncharacterized protein n=1 Tax=Cylindrotheca closterium TaxID=2856 RepID=A0AAD2FJY1_9STRA|nr:unnamed protein product [Cylindrotheca closterium]
MQLSLSYFAVATATSAAFQLGLDSRSAGITPFHQRSQFQLSLQKPSGNDEQEDNMLNNPIERRQALRTALLSASILTPTVARAFDRSFPDELTESDKSVSVVSIGGRSNAQQRATAAKEKEKAMKKNLINPFSVDDLLPSLVWSGALWFLSGSRSNPLTTPLGNLLYNEEEAQWLKDRNAGLFAAPPFEFLVLLGLVFVVLGFATQFALLQLAEGDSVVCFQLAGVALIWGGFFEIGRLASGEKRATREEFDRRLELKDEFDEFAKARILTSGNCHRSDVIAAFRRYNAKYRDPESTEYPLTDLEINKLLRMWNELENSGKAEMTSSGFWYGIEINKDADIIASRL